MEMTMQPLMAGSGRPTLSVRYSIGTDDYSNYKKPLTDVGLDEEGTEDSYAKGFKPVGAWNDSWEDE